MNQIPNRSPYGITPGNPIQGFYSTGVCRLLSLALSSVLRANTKNIIVLEPPSTLPPPAMQTPPPRKKGSLLSVVYWGSAGANINRFFFLKDFQMASVFPCVLWNFKKNLYGKGLFLFSSVTLWYCPEFFDVEFRKSYPLTPILCFFHCPGPRTPQSGLPWPSWWKLSSLLVPSSGFVSFTVFVMIWCDGAYRWSLVHLSFALACKGQGNQPCLVLPSLHLEYYLVHLMKFVLFFFPLEEIYVPTKSLACVHLLISLPT